MFDPAINRRRSIRLRTHDYAAGGTYYVTICAEERRRLFGVVVNGRMALNDAGRMVTHWFRELENKYPDVLCDAFVCMPDHVHFVVRTGFESNGNGPVGANLCVRPLADAEPFGAGNHGGEYAGSPLRNVVAWFKTMTTNAYIRRVKQSGWPPFPGTLWQRNYYEHIVRDAADLARIRAYIRDNPANWDVLRYGEMRFMIGNRTLLDVPKVAYLASRGGVGRTRDEVGRTRDEVGRTRRFAPTECVISGFLSPLEHEVFEACLADGLPMIRVLACGMPARFPPRVQRALDSGRLLVMTPFGPEVTRVNAEHAAWCNQYLLHAADRVVIGQLNPDGMLACLLADMPADKPIIFPT